MPPSGLETGNFVKMMSYQPNVNEPAMNGHLSCINTCRVSLYLIVKLLHRQDMNPGLITVPYS